jgi:DNA-binding NarL/FixJ family response regulator
LVEAEALAVEALTHAREAGDEWLLINILSFKGEVAQLRGDVEEASALFGESLELMRELNAVETGSNTLASLGHLALQRGDLRRAATFFTEQLSLDLEKGSMWLVSHSLTGIVGVAVALGQMERAARLSGAVEAMVGASGAFLLPVEQAAFKQHVALARSSLGDRAFAAAWQRGQGLSLKQAAVEAEQVATSMDRVLQDPAPVPAGRSAPPTEPHPAGLTDREVEVLRHLSLGLTSAQIADRLVISPATVNTHLRNIYDKLGVSSRSAATRWAVQHGLA